MSDTEQAAPASRINKDMLKFGGGLFFLCAALGLMFHRMPHRRYVEAHADKPRERPVPQPAVAAAAPASTSQARPAALAGRGSAPKTPTPNVARPTTTLPLASLLANDSSGGLEDVCYSEIGILCRQARARDVRRCLAAYQDALLRPCRAFLYPGSVPVEP